MSSTPIFIRGVLGSWRGLLAWAAAIVAVLLLYLPLYPSMQTPELSQMINNLPSELVQALGYEDITSGAGYTQATFFGLIGFILIIIAAISWGSAAIAGNEESGQLELTLAHAVGRVQYALESAAALVVKVLLLGVVAFLGITLLNGPSELVLQADNLLAVILAWTGLGLTAGTVALAAGAVTGKRAWAVGASSSVVVLGYAFDALGEMNPDMEWLQPFSPYHWAFRNAPLAQGVDWGGLTLLWGLSFLLIGVSAWALARRDITG